MAALTCDNTPKITNYGCSIRRRDLDPTRSTLAIRRSLEEVKGKLILGEAKTGVGRVITLPSTLAA